MASNSVQLTVGESTALTLNVEAGQNHEYTATLTLKPENNQATQCQIETIYYGDNALNLTLVDTLPDGTETTIFTTLQYFGYKPTANTTWLTIEPQATQLTTTTKSPEQLQAEAKQSGWLSTWHSLHGSGHSIAYM